MLHRTLALVSVFLLVRTVFYSGLVVPYGWCSCVTYMYIFLIVTYDVLEGQRPVYVGGPWTLAVLGKSFPEQSVDLQALDGT